MAYRLRGPDWLAERQMREIFGATADEFARWRITGKVRPEQILPRVYRYRLTHIEQLANTPGAAAVRARRQYHRQFVRRVTEPGDVAPTPEGTSRAASRW
jgi:hypothetical protein